MDRLQRLFQGTGAAGAGGGPPADTPQVDTAEQIYISSLALLKMLKHGEMQLRQSMLSCDQASGGKNHGTRHSWAPRGSCISVRLSVALGQGPGRWQSHSWFELGPLMLHAAPVSTAGQV